MDWTVYSCHRLRSNRFDCDYEIFFEYSESAGGGEFSCFDTLRITKRTYSTSYTFPSEPDCG